MLLEIKNLFFSFEGLNVTNDINITVKEKSITALIGPNGSGKTTLFNIITGNYHPKSGEIIFDNKRIDGLKPYQICELGISRTYQVINLFKKMSVLDNVLVGMHSKVKESFFDDIFHTKRMNKIEKEAKANALELLDFVGLLDEKDNNADNLSYGQQRLLEIVRAIASNPKLLLLDEPAAGMNETEKNNLNKLIKKIISMDITVLIVEHDMELIMDIADEIYVIDAGKNLASGTPNQIQNNEKVISAYLGGDD